MMTACPLKCYTINSMFGLIRGRGHGCKETDGKKNKSEKKENG